jgi:hypothetical protein
MRQLLYAGMGAKDHAGREVSSMRLTMGAFECGGVAGNDTLF